MAARIWRSNSGGFPIRGRQWDLHVNRKILQLEPGCLVYRSRREHTTSMEPMSSNRNPQQTEPRSKSGVTNNNVVRAVPA